MEIKKFIGQLNPYENNRKVDQTAKDGAGKGQKADKGQAQTSDTVNLSDAAKLLGTARSEAQRSDGVRKEKVAELKERIASGEYQPDLKKAAKNLIRDDLEMLL